MYSADEIVRTLSLERHPEGGYFRETFRDKPLGENIDRSASTAILYLLAEDQVSHWHRIDSTEIWHWYAGAALQISIAEHEKASPKTEILGTEFFDNQLPQLIVPGGYWQSARSLGAWTLVGCTVAPGFEFENFELADPDFSPGP